MTRAELRGTKAQGADFSDADLSLSTWSDAKAARAMFVGAILEDTRFEKCDFSESDFTATQVTAADLKGSTTRGAVLPRPKK